MKHFVLLEDSYQDASLIQDCLADLQPSLPHTLIHFDNLHAGLNHISSNTVDLLLLDLEFTLANMTAASIIDDIPSSIPILVVSHLTHYQKPLSLKMNVKGFIHKANLSTSLVSAIKKIFDVAIAANERPREFIFPAIKSSHIPESILVRDIRYIEFQNRKNYTVHLVDGTLKTLQSVSFNDLCKQLILQKTESLCPVNKNQIINIDYIKSVHKMENGRLEVELVNLPLLKFHVGSKHQKPFEIFF